LHVSGGNIKLDNNYAIVWRNSPNNGDLPILQLDSSDNVTLSSGYTFSFNSYNGGGIKMTIVGNGNVGIGTTGPSYRLQVGETSNYGYVDGNGAWQTGSDRRFKENIRDLDSALEKILSLRGVEYNTKGDEPEKEKQVGFIAQDVEKVIPGVVSTDKNGFKGIAYAKLTPVLVEAIKELKESGLKNWRKNRKF
jgi:hypothetical protein